MTLRIKICGITRLEDALVAESAGADAIGLNFVPNTKRFILPEEAANITKHVGALISRVGIFRDAPLEEILRVAQIVQLSAVQLHGHESDEFAALVETHIPVIRVVAFSAALPVAQTLLIDSLEGGSGQTFDWSVLDTSSLQGRRWLLAGGLTPENVAAAVQTLQPWGVDVASGVESIVRIKDATKIQNFITAARAVIN